MNSAGIESKVSDVTNPETFCGKALYKIEPNSFSVFEFSVKYEQL